MRAAGLIVLVAAAPGALLAVGPVAAQTLPPPPYASGGGSGSGAPGSPAYAGSAAYTPLDRYGGGRRPDPMAPSAASQAPAGGAPAGAYLSWNGKTPMQTQAVSSQTGGWSSMAGQWGQRAAPKPRFRLPWSRPTAAPQAQPPQSQTAQAPYSPTEAPNLQAMRPQDMAPPVRPWSRTQDQAPVQAQAQSEADAQSRAQAQTAAADGWRPLYPQAATPQAPAAPAPAPTSIYDPVPAASQQVQQPQPPQQAPTYRQAQTGDSTGPRFYSLHREYGIQPDAIPLPPQFFGPTADLSTPPADPQLRRTTTSTGQTRTAAAPDATDAGQ